MSFIVFFGGFFGIAIWESFQPRKLHIVPVRLRWTANISLGVINLALFGILLPVSEFVRPDWIPSAAGDAWHWIGDSEVATLLIAFLLLDLFNYIMHRLFHSVPPLWRLHLIHHADPEIDVSTAVRHHPFEDFVGYAPVVLLAVAFGVPLAAISAYTLANSLVANIHHGNIRFPALLERVAAIFLVTPNVHRIHHSVDVSEGNSNFGAIFTVWDRLFGTFISRSPPEHEQIEFGLRGFLGPQYCQLHRVLSMPFVGRDTRQTI